MKIKLNIYHILVLILSVFVFVSCPEPITEEIVAKVEDEGAPSIIVSSPSNNSLYRSSVTFTGRVEDDAKNSIERFSFDVQNRSISGGVVISSGNVAQDSSAGTTPVSYNSSTGAFSFDFSTVDPDVLTGRLFVNLEAVDWNGNTAEETLILYENTDGLYLDLTSPTIDTTYETSISISGTVLDFNTTPISIENIDYIKWQLESDSRKLQIYPISTTDADNDGVILNNTFQFNINDGSFSDSISMVGESGSKAFSFYAADLNGHIKEIEYNISDGNVSPDIELDSATPSEFTDNNRYLSIGDEISFSCHVGPTAKTIESITYRVTPGDGTASQTLNFTSYNNNGDGTTTFYFDKSGIDTSSYSDSSQILILECTALGSSESSTKNVFFNADNTAPLVSRHYVASSAGIKNTYVDIEINDSSDADLLPDKLWGARYRASLLTASDLEIVKKTNTSEVISIGSIQEIGDFDSPSPSSVTGGTGTFRMNIADKNQISAKDGTTLYTLRSKSSDVSNSSVALDKANNILTSYDFVFLDEASPVVDTLTPLHNSIVSLSSGNLTLLFSEGDLSPSTVSVQLYKDGSGTPINKTATLSDDTLSIPFSDGDGEYSVVIPGGVIKDTSDNYFAGITSGNWVFTADTTDPSVDSITAQIGGAGGDITGTLISAPASNIEFAITLSDITVISKGTGDLIQLVRSSSSDVDINMSAVTLSGLTATVSVDKSYFNSDEDYHLRLLEGAFVDAASNPSPLTNGSSFTVDADPPSVDSITAQIGGAGSDVTGSVIKAPASDIKFTISMSDSSSLSKGTGELIQLVKDSVAILNINMSTVTLSGSTATFTVSKDNFASDGAYNLKLLSGAFIDEASNISPEMLGSAFEVDGTVPSVSSITAKIGGAGSDITGTNITAPASNIEFTVTLSDNTDLSKGTGNLIQLIKDSSSVLNIDMSTVTLSGSTATVTVDKSNFTSDGDYNLKLLSGAFADEASNLTTETSGSTFKVDDSAPSVTSLTAQIGGAGSDITSTIINTYPSGNILFTITLSDSTSLSKGTGDLIQLVRSSSSAVSINMSAVTLTGSTATISIDKSNFESDEDYNLRLLEGSFIDAVSNPLPQTDGSTFTVDTKPYVVESSKSPADGSYINDTSPTVEFDFDENVSTGTGTNAGKVSVGGIYYTVSETSGSITFTLPDDTLSDGNIYSVGFDASAFKDVDGTEHFCDAYSGSWSFTVDTTPPVVGEPTSPETGTVYTSSQTIDVIFTVSDTNSIYEKSGGSSVIFDTSGTDVTCTDVTVLDAAAGTVRASISTSSLAEDKTYNLKVNAGEFVDSAGNGNTGKTSTWSITINLVP